MPLFKSSEKKKPPAQSKSRSGSASDHERSSKLGDKQQPPAKKASTTSTNLGKNVTNQDVMRNEDIRVLQRQLSKQVEESKKKLDEKEAELKRLREQLNTKKLSQKTSHESTKIPIDTSSIKTADSVKKTHNGCGKYFNPYKVLMIIFMIALAIISGLCGYLLGHRC